MSERSYGVTHIDELESFPIPNQQGLTWRPIRRRFDIRSFGANAYTAEETGQRVVEEHCEADGHEELYEVVSGRATFTLEGEEHDAPAGTLVHCPPGTLRSAFAAEPGTGSGTRTPHSSCSSGRRRSTRALWPGARSRTRISSRYGTIRVFSPSPGSRTPPARLRKAGSGSASGRATSSTAP